MCFWGVQDDLVPFVIVSFYCAFTNIVQPRDEGSISVACKIEVFALLLSILSFAFDRPA